MRRGSRYVCHHGYPCVQGLGSLARRAGRAVGDEFYNDEPIEVILPTVPPRRRQARRHARLAAPGATARAGRTARAAGRAERRRHAGRRAGRARAPDAATGSGARIQRRRAAIGAVRRRRRGTPRPAGGAGAEPGEPARPVRKRAADRAAAGSGERRPGGHAPPTRDPVVILAKWLFHSAVKAGWMLLAGTVGFAVRRFGRSARDLHPDHQRDGVGLFCLGLAIVFAAASGCGCTTPRARRSTPDKRALGDGAFPIPLLLALLGWRFMRHPDRNSETPAAVIGWTALLIGVLGLFSIAKGTPHPSTASARDQGRGRVRRLRWPPRRWRRC